jgi:hypothetical protein
LTVADSGTAKRHSLYRRKGQYPAQYQWFWEGTQEETKKLTPDLKHSVKRHIVVRRVIPIENFPTKRVEAAKARRDAVDEEQKCRNAGFSPPSEKVQRTINATIRAKKEKYDDQQSYPSLRELLSFDFSIDVCLPMHINTYSHVVGQSEATVWKTTSPHGVELQSSEVLVPATHIHKRFPRQAKTQCELR